MQEHATQTTQEVPETAPGQVDDINIPLVAVSVVFFACLLTATILSLQAWFTSADRAEVQAKTALQEDPHAYATLARGTMATPLGQILQEQRAQLEVAPLDRKTLAAAPAATRATTSSQPARNLWVPIDTAMELTSKDYEQGKSRPE